ncbi:hypothetical protein R50073_28940 [Maricurvus nonylphenolicus]|uniref:hypothetical protein n=1 Tax=Maricurvus nonylphenolicus TaxID=1008307 RepID=UPI0036F30DC5
MLSSSVDSTHQPQAVSGPSLELKLVLNHLSDDFAGTAIQTSEQQRHVVYGIDCGRAHLLLGNDIACEVVSDGACFALPNAPESLLGLHVSRGDLIPVYRVENALQGLYPKQDSAEVSQLDVAQTNNHSSRAVDVIPLMLLLGKGEARVGIVLQRLPRLYDLTGQKPVQTQARFSEQVNQFTRQTYHVENQWWLAFDWLAFLRVLSDI